MSGSVAQRARPSQLRVDRQLRSVRLCVVLHEQQVVATADVGDAFRPGTTAIEVYEQQRAGARCDVSLQLVLVNLERVGTRLHEHRPQSVLRDGEHRGDECVGRHQHLVVRLQQSQLQVGTIDQRQRIEAVGNADAVARTDERRVSRLERPRLLTLQIAARVDHLPHCLLILFSVAGRHLL